MKITIDLSDELANAAKAHAASQNMTLRALIERGLRMVLRADPEAEPFRLRDASVGGRGLQPAFRDAEWSRIREAIYEGRCGVRQRPDARLVTADQRFVNALAMTDHGDLVMALSDATGEE